MARQKSEPSKATPPAETTKQAGPVVEPKLDTLLPAAEVPDMDIPPSPSQAYSDDAEKIIADAQAIAAEIIRNAQDHAASIAATIGAPEVIAPRTDGMILIANHHTGGITFPMRDGNGTVLPPLRLAPGVVSLIPADEWQKRKKMLVVQHYLDKGLLAEVRTDNGPVPVLCSTSTELIIPENLRNEQEEGQYAKAGLDQGKTRAGTITIG